jgi:hypothetical protein
MVLSEFLEVYFKRTKFILSFEAQNFTYYVVDGLWKCVPLVSNMPTACSQNVIFQNTVIIILIALYFLP